LGEELVLELQGAPDIPAPLVGYGTLLVLGILTAMMGTDHPKLILLDDLDHGLHPRTRRDLDALLRKFIEQAPELQIVATSPSPYLLDELDPEEMRMTIRRDDGSVACARLDEHPISRNGRKAERGGFEPPVRFDPHTAFPVPHNRPLCHLSVSQVFDYVRLASVFSANLFC
jgi:hypothetical protein